MRSSGSPSNAWGVGAHGLDQVAGLQGAGVEGGAGDLRQAGVAGEAHNRAAGAGVPPGRAKAREGRDQHHAQVVTRLSRQPLCRLGPPADVQALAQPLDRGAGDEDRALERIGGLAADPRRDRGQ